MKQTDSSSPINNVSDTSFWVAYYRVKETERKDAMFRDPFARVLVGERGKQISDSMPEISKYTEWSVISRTVIIDRYITRLVKEGVDAIVNLGAGLDARPYRMDLPSSLQWVEADYSHILDHKTRLLKDETPRCNLKRVAVDLSDTTARQAFLETVVPDAKKVLVLTEGVIPYLTPAQVGDLADDLRKQSRIQYWITEYFHPRVYRYLKDTVRAAKMRNAPFQFYPEDWHGFFATHGWKERETRFTGEIAIEFKRTPPAPAWAKFVMPFVPKHVKEEMRKMTGFTLFEKS